MIRNALERLFNSTLYLRVWRERLVLRQAETGREISGSPRVAVDKGNRVLAVGDQVDDARLRSVPGYRVLNGFDHPRMVIGNFEVAEAAVRFYIQKLIHKWVFLRPRVVIHPMETYEGGLSQIELRALRDLCASAGAREVTVWTGSDLTDAELRSKDFPRYKGEVH